MSAVKPSVTQFVAGHHRADGLLPLDWGSISPLRLHAQSVADGVYMGRHRSIKRGPGVEFGGHRPYVAGDDLRFLDRRSLLCHDRLMVRQFETDTERALLLCLDASASMAFCGPDAPGAKLAYAALVAAALGRIAIAGQDPVGLAWMAGADVSDLSLGFGPGAFERLVGALSAGRAAGDLSVEVDAAVQVGERFAQRLNRGSVLLWFSDLLDVPDPVRNAMVALAGARRAMIVVQVLDPRERDLSYSGHVRLRSVEGDQVVVADADAVRGVYLERLAAHTRAWKTQLESRGARLIVACTSDDPISIVRDTLRAISQVKR